MGIALAEGLKWKRHIAAAAGKKESVPLSLFMEKNVEVEEDFFTMAAVFWAEVVWTGREQQKAWRSSMETDERASRRVVMLETRDLGIKWPQGHTVKFKGTSSGGHEGGLPAGCEDVVCETSQDGNWKKWAAKHDCEEKFAKTCGWSQSKQCYGGRLTNRGRASTDMC